MENGKTLLMSKTFWVNVIGLVGIILTGLGVLGDTEWIQYEAVALGAINVALRMVTGQPITGIIVQPEDTDPA
jgi:uncharacterized membrane protein